jgi:hypothetical protein
VLVESVMSHVNKTYKVGPRTLSFGTLLLSVAVPTFRFPPLLGTFGHLGRI